VIECHSRILLKDVHTNGKTIKSILLDEHEEVVTFMFSKGVDGHGSILIHYTYWNEDNEIKMDSIKIWRRYDVVDEDGDPDTMASMITIVEKSVPVLSEIGL
jgi:hypothetical protein